MQQLAALLALEQLHAVEPGSCDAKRRVAYRLTRRTPQGFSGVPAPAAGPLDANLRLTPSKPCRRRAVA
jgi:hypothetical protein